MKTCNQITFRKLIQLARTLLNEPSSANLDALNEAMWHYRYINDKPDIKRLMRLRIYIYEHCPDILDKPGYLKPVKD